MTCSILNAALSNTIQTDPFVYMVKQPALRTSLYDTLSADFPSAETILDGRTAPGGNYAARMPVAKILFSSKISESWKQFARYHCSSEYWQEILHFFEPHFLEQLPGIDKVFGKKMRDWRVAPRYLDDDADLHLDCQLVVNTPNQKRSSVRTVHCDRPTTIFSGLLYMRDEKDLAEGGDLELFRWRRNPRFLQKFACARSDVEQVQAISYEANKFVCFVNSPHAIHGVSPRDIAPLPRRYVNFIARVRHPLVDFKKASFIYRILSQIRGAGFERRNIRFETY